MPDEHRLAPTDPRSLDGFPQKTNDLPEEYKQK